MSEKLLSICIPTYNRADCLKRLLDNVIPQVLESKGEAEVCISNNGSTDNTRDTALNFKQKYPYLIKYNENEKNLGFDRNVLKVVDMAEGEFIWTFSDDDLPVKDGVKNVIEFIKKNKNKKIGGMVVKFSSYLTDAKTGKRIKYQSSVDENKPETYGGLNCLDMLKEELPYGGLSVLIFNNKLLEKILNERPDLAKMGIDTNQFHSWLFFLLFLLDREAECYVLNKTMAISPDLASKYKYKMEDYFLIIYKGRIKFFDNLVSIIDKSEKKIIEAVKKQKKHPTLSVIYIAALYKAFGNMSYASCFKCINISFQYLPLVKAFFVLASLIIILIIPSPMVKKLCKISLRFRSAARNKIESAWLETQISASFFCPKGEKRIVR